MADDPYSKIINLLKQNEKLPPMIALGTVAGDAPLEIDVQNLRQTSGDLSLNSAFLQRGELGEYLDPLKRGDRVLTISLDGGQSFIVLCKVVSA